jgi:hypothetical protein
MKMSLPPSLLTSSATQSVPSRNLLTRKVRKPIGFHVQSHSFILASAFKYACHPSRTVIPHRQDRFGRVLFDFHPFIDTITDDYRLANPTGNAGVNAEHWINLHDRIKPTSKPSKIRKPNPANNDQLLDLEKKDVTFDLPVEHSSSKLSVGIDKNSILSEYQASCIVKGILSDVSTVLKGETPSSPQYPSHYCLISKCRMKPSRNLQY